MAPKKRKTPKKQKNRRCISNVIYGPLDRRTLKPLAGTRGVFSQFMSAIKPCIGQKATCGQILRELANLCAVFADNPKLVDTPDALMPIIVQRVPWASSISQDNLFFLFQTFVASKRNFNSRTGSQHCQGPLAQHLQRYINFTKAMAAAQEHLQPWIPDATGTVWTIPNLAIRTRPIARTDEPVLPATRPAEGEPSEMEHVRKRLKTLHI